MRSRAEARHSREWTSAATSMSDLARSEARNSRSAGSVRLPVLGAAGGNVGVAVQANRSAQRVSAQRDNGARRSSPVKALSLQSDNPEPSPVAAKLPCDGDNVRNGQATLRSRPRKVKIGGEHVYCVQIASDRDGSNSADSGCRSSATGLNRSRGSC